MGAAMVTLSLLRHAKSRWGLSGVQDFDRPLAPRGLKAAPAMGRFMQERGIAPDLVLCSPARRTRETLDLVLPFLTPAPEIRIDDNLYPASAEDMLDALREVGDGHAHILVIGHNPGLQVLGRDLTGGGEEGLVSDLSAKFPTCALAVLSFDNGWEELEPASGHLKLFMVPKRLKNENSGT